MKKLVKEFKTFISRGNVLDLAVGMIIGSAFTAIVTALSNGILKPIINMALYYAFGGDAEALNKMYTILVAVPEVDETGAYVANTVDLAKSIYIDWGAFISAIINFLLIALVLFLIIKSFNAAKDAKENAHNIEKKIALKQEKGLKLTKKEKAFVAAKEEAERKAKEEAEAAALAPKEPTTEELLQEIIVLLKDKK